jgi:hypothetical protein
MLGLVDELRKVRLGVGERGLDHVTIMTKNLDLPTVQVACRR